MAKSRVVSVLAGGDSAERSVSLVSGRGVLEAFHQFGTQAELLQIEDTADLVRRLPEIEVGFSVLHGGDGEDGTIQQVFEDHSIPYVGSGPEASRIGMDKLATKERLTSVGIPVPRAMIPTGSSLDAFTARVGRAFGFPVILKALTQGSTLGVMRIDSPDDLVRSIEEVRAQFGSLFVEEFIRGREFTVSILRINHEDRVLPIIEILVHTDFLDFETKYGDGFCEMVVPALLDSETELQMRDIALRTHQVLGCWGFSRVDVLLSDEGTPYVLETNTLPGMTPHSALPKSAQAAGIDYPHLVDVMLQSAYTRPSKEL
ncbi:MAG: D-alanine--D-alanine ligase [Candidatus Bipolaricaulota bacterium]